MREREKKRERERDGTTCKVRHLKHIPNTSVGKGRA